MGDPVLRLPREGDMHLSRVRLTVGRMLVAVAVIGLDLGFVCEAYQADESEPCTSSLTLPTLTYVPPLSLLLVAAASGARDLQTRFGLAIRDWLLVLRWPGESPCLSRLRRRDESTPGPSGLH